MTANDQRQWDLKVAISILIGFCIFLKLFVEDRHPKWGRHLDDQSSRVHHRAKVNQGDTIAEAVYLRIKNLIKPEVRTGRYEVHLNGNILPYIGNRIAREFKGRYDPELVSKNSLYRHLINDYHLLKEWAFSPATRSEEFEQVVQLFESKGWQRENSYEVIKQAYFDIVKSRVSRPPPIVFEMTHLSADSVLEKLAIHAAVYKRVAIERLKFMTGITDDSFYEQLFSIDPKEPFYMFPGRRPIIRPGEKIDWDKTPNEFRRERL